MLTYNLHGFNQGESFLIDACNSGVYDIIFLQEHWLNTDNITKLSAINTDYFVFGESAMIKENASTILYGRPYGGVASLVNKRLLPDCKCKYVGERIVALSVCNSLFINTYLPCDDGSVSSSDNVIEKLSIITDLINESNYDSIFIVGDLNTNLSSDRKKVNFLLKLYSMNNSMSFMVPVDSDLNVCHTFSNDKTWMFKSN